MSVQAVSSAAVSSQAQDSGATQPAGSAVSDLEQLEQNVRSTESTYKRTAKHNGLSEAEIGNRVQQYERLIAQIRQQINAAKQSKRRRALHVHQSDSVAKAQKLGASLLSGEGASVAALQNSYISMPIPSVDAGAAISLIQPAAAASADASVTPQKLNQMA